MRGRSARVKGLGPAGLTLARLLARNGWSVQIENGNMPRRAVSIPLQTLTLLSELWDFEANMLTDATRYRYRVVDWSGPEPAFVNDHSVLVSLSDLSSRMIEILDRDSMIQFVNPGSSYEEGWTILGTGRPEPDVALIGGRRQATFYEVNNLTSDRETVRVVAEKGCWSCHWPNPHSSLMFVVTASADISPTQVIGPLIEEGAEIVQVGTAVSCAPVLARDIVEPGFLRVGDAALTIDPLRGDGVGYAIRGAILAAATLNAAESASFEIAPVLAYYRMRLERVFLEHVGNLCIHYRSVRYSQYWTSEIEMMETTKAHLLSRTRSFPSYFLSVA